MSTPMFVDTTASGTIAALNDQVSIDCNGAGSVTIQIDGLALSPVLTFEGTTDGTNYWPLDALDLVNFEPVQYASSISGIGMWQINAAGLKTFRVRCSSYSGTDTYTVALSASAGSSREVIFPNDIEVKQGDAATNATYGWYMRLTDGSHIAAVNSNGSLQVAQSGTWTTGRTWNLTSASDTINVNNFPAIQPASQSGTWNINNISGTISLPSGASSAAKQDTGNTSLNSIDSKTPSQGQKTMALSSPVTFASDQSSLPVTVGNFPGTQAVSGIFWQSIQPVSGPLTDTQLRASAVPVSGSFYQSTQPVSGTFWQSIQPISGTISANQSGTWNARMQDGFGTALSTTSGNLDINIKGVSASSLGSISLGNSSGKTNIGQPGTKITTATTADQVIVTYTVTIGKTFYLQGFDCSSRLTTFASTATNFGNFSLESPSGTKLYTGNIANSGNGSPQGMKFEEPLPIASGTVIRLVCTPSAATSFTWQGNLMGYEK